MYKIFKKQINLRLKSSIFKVLSDIGQKTIKQLKLLAKIKLDVFLKI